MTTTTPVTVTAEAAARAEELGMRSELDRMLDYTLGSTPGLRAIRVTREDSPDCPAAAPQLVIWAHRDDLPADGGFDRTDWDWGGWQAATFPPEVCMQIVMLSVYGDAHAW